MFYTDFDKIEKLKTIIDFANSSKYGYPPLGPAKTIAKLIKQSYDPSSAKGECYKLIGIMYEKHRPHVATDLINSIEEELK